jgi:hypothetical protein
MGFFPFGIFAGGADVDDEDLEEVEEVVGDKAGFLPFVVVVVLVEDDDDDEEGEDVDIIAWFAEPVCRRAAGLSL